MQKDFIVTATPRRRGWPRRPGGHYFSTSPLLFRADKAVQNNSTGNVVALGASKDTANVFLPRYMRAAEKHMKLRLYGILVPIKDAKPAKSPASPSVQFITWKMHLPSEPDELPAGDKINITPNQSVPGYTIKSRKEE